MRSTSLAAAFLLGIAASLSPALAGDGDLDTAFDGDGIWVATSGGSHSFTRAVRDPDGAAVVFGTRYANDTQYFHWRRVTLAGAGALCSHLPVGATLVRPGDVTFDYAGRLLFSGLVRIGDADPVVLVMRYLYPACTLDPDFDGGVATHALGLANHELTWVPGIATPRWFDGLMFRNRVLVPLAVDDSAVGSETHLMRLLEDGSLDSGFGGGDGKLQLASARHPRSMARTLDGFYVVAGTTDDGGGVRTFVRKFDRNGAPVTAFGTAGETLINIPDADDDALGQLAVGSDGRIAVAGDLSLDASSSIEQAAVAVLTADGDLDTGFSGDGWTTFEHPGAERTDFRAVALQGDGRVLVAGRASDPANPSDDEAFAMRFYAGGAVEGSFGEGGVTWLDLDDVPEGEELGSGIALDDSGRIWFAGSTQVEVAPGDTDYRPFVARLQSSYVFADGFERGSTASW